MLGKCLGEMRGAVGLGQKEKIIRLRRIERGLNRIERRITDRGGRQPAMFIRIVGRINFEIVEEGPRVIFPTR